MKRKRGSGIELHLHLLI